LRSAGHVELSPDKGIRQPAGHGDDGHGVGNDSPTTATSAPRAPAHATTRGNDDDPDFEGDF